MADVVIATAGLERLNDIKPLWEQLNAHHRDVSPHFKDEFEGYAFAFRKAYLATKATKGNLRIFFAEAGESLAGYCVASIDSHLQGEIDSIFVAEEFRGQKTGDSLMRAALVWLDEKGATSKSVSVVHGNESVFSFYEKYGFLPRSTRLAQV